MVLMAISGTLLGAVFGLRFKVLVLLPVLLVGVLSIAAASAISGTPIATIAIDAIAWSLALQFGYLGGLLTRSVMVATRIRSRPQSHSLARAPH
jgi:hypothetical protein